VLIWSAARGTSFTEFADFANRLEHGELRASRR
jgi:hypothetical protein